MRADNTTHLITAACRRHEVTRAKTPRALHELAHADTPVSFQAVAAQAEVSRSWLYIHADIKTEIQRLRALNNRTPQAPIPARQRTTLTSLLGRLEIANNRNRELNEDDERLRCQLAQALGHNRRTEASASGDPATRLGETQVALR
jgi:hypothetical protein